MNTFALTGLYEGFFPSHSSQSPSGTDECQLDRRQEAQLLQRDRVKRYVSIT